MGDPATAADEIATGLRAGPPAAGRRLPHDRPGERRGALLELVRPSARRSSAGGPLPESSEGPTARLRNAIYRRMLGAADISSATVAVLTAVTLLGEDAARWTWVLVLPLILVASKVAGLYDRDEHVMRKATLEETPAVFQIATLVAFLAWLGERWLVQGELGHSQVLGLWGLLFVLMLTSRAAVRRASRLVVSEERCLVIGAGPAAWTTQAKLAGCPDIKARVVGWVPLEDSGEETVALPMLGEFDRLGVTLAEHDIDRVIIAPATADSEQILHAIRVVKALGVRVSVLPRLFEVIGSSVEFDVIDGLTLLGVRPYGLSRSSALVKRCLDGVLSGLGLLALAPLFAMLAVVIKVTSPGPVFFRQQRIGRGNVPFEIFKFRTMVDGADAQKAALHERNEAGGGLFKIADDPRITTVGRYLRASSLDELPQLINVLRGDMALVGPRPLVVDEDRRIEGWQRRRSLLTPGMTGLWQIFGSARIPLHEMVKIDYWYGANWSLWLDVKILLRTVPFMLTRRGL